MIESTTAHLFRRAWLSNTGDDQISRLCRMSLEMAADDVPELAAVLEELRGDDVRA